MNMMGKIRYVVAIVDESMNELCNHFPPTMAPSEETVKQLVEDYFQLAWRVELMGRLMMELTDLVQDAGG